MKITNKMGLPQALVDAVSNDTYSKGDCDYSVTELLQPPRISALRRIHEDDIVEDASDRIWSLYGQVVHSVLERAGYKNLTELKEWRGFIDIAGKRISGQIDSLHLIDGTLSDYKFTSTWTVKGGKVRDEWLAQVNAYALIARAAGLDVKALTITALLRDWSTLEAKRSSDYPQAGSLVIPIPIWPEAETLRFFTERIRLHEAARAGELPVCTPEERWQRPTVYAVMREGRKSALRLLDSATEAAEWKGANGKPTDSIVERPGESVRCANYCAVSPFCSQWASIAPVPEERPAMLSSLPF